MPDDDKGIGLGWGGRSMVMEEDVIRTRNDLRGKAQQQKDRELAVDVPSILAESRQGGGKRGREAMTFQ